MDCVPAPHNEHKKSICDYVKNELFLIKLLLPFKTKWYHTGLLKQKSLDRNPHLFKPEGFLLKLEKSLKKWKKQR